MVSGTSVTTADKGSRASGDDISSVGLFSRNNSLNIGGILSSNAAGASASSMTVFGVHETSDGNKAGDIMGGFGSGGLTGSGSGTGSSVLSNTASRLQFVVFETLGALRISELFDIIKDFPSSRPALDDLRLCLTETNQHVHLGMCVSAFWFCMSTFFFQFSPCELKGIFP